jgi:hypothetical protein
MTFVRTLSLLLLTLCAGCTSAPLTAPAHPVRILASEAARAPVPEPETAKTHEPNRAPRIGAPGGSGAGSRRVAPVQSGNETVGGLPAGAGATTGAAGRG